LEDRVVGKERVKLFKDLDFFRLSKQFKINQLLNGDNRQFEQEQHETQTIYFCTVSWLMVVGLYR